MKRHLVSTILAGLLFIFLMTLSLFTAVGSPPAQLNPTQQEGTVQALVETYFRQTEDAALRATAEIRFREALEATLAAAPSGIREFSFTNGRGARKGIWDVYFTQPAESRDRSLWRDGIDTALAQAIDQVAQTLDIAAFELNNVVITQAIIDAHERGVRVRIVNDNEHGIDDDDSTLLELQLLGIPIVNDGRSALMHNKFMIMDRSVVWAGSTNYTMNDVYRNNNNMIVLRVPQAVIAFQAEFDEMFLDGQFGPRSPRGNDAQFVYEGTPIEIYFAPEDPVIDRLVTLVNEAQSSIRFMAFSFTQLDLGRAMLTAAARGVDVRGVFETTGSQTASSNLPPMFCAGLDVRQDGNPGIMHHKVIIIDERIVVTGSFNFSNNAMRSNDENVVIITDPDLARLYLDEFARLQAVARSPEGRVQC